MEEHLDHLRQADLKTDRNATTKVHLIQLDQCTLHYLNAIKVSSGFNDSTSQLRKKIRQVCFCRCGVQTTNLC